MIFKVNYKQLDRYFIFQNELLPRIKAEKMRKNKFKRQQKERH